MVFMKRRRRGFTMLEMVAVVIIIAFLATMAVQQVSGNILLARIDSAKAELRNIGNAIETYAVRNPNAMFPASLQDLQTMGLLRFTKIDKTSGEPLDPWGQPWGYCAPDRTNDQLGAVWSKGPNGGGNVTCPRTPNTAPTPSGDTSTYGLYYIIDPKP